MGYYVQTNAPKDKLADILKMESSAKEVSRAQAQVEFYAGRGIICVVDNGPFEAAGFCYSQDELDAFMHTDYRPKRWISMDRERAEILSGYKG